MTASDSKDMTKAKTGSHALKDRHIIVTGAGRGIGTAIAHELAAQGAKLSLVGRTKANLEQLASQLKESYGVQAQSIVIDLSKADGVASGFKQSQDSFGVVYALVNNAGAASSAPIMKLSEADWQSMLELNLSAVYRTSQAVLEGMLKAKQGRIVNIASTAGVKGYPYVAAYCAAKHGVVGLTKALAVELAASGVTVNAVCPGFSDTEMFWSSVKNIALKTGRSETEVKSELLSSVPNERLIAPTEIASVVSWLCQDQQAAITGQAIVISAGEQ